MITCHQCKYFEKVPGMIDRDKNSAGICYGMPPSMVLANIPAAGIQTAQPMQTVPVALNTQVSSGRSACSLFAKAENAGDNVIALNRKTD